MNTFMSALVASTTEEFMYSTKFCDKFRFAYSTLSARIRSGEIALHQFPGEQHPRINVAEALQVMSVIKRPYNSPDLRVVHHNQKPISAASRGFCWTLASLTHLRK